MAFAGCPALTLLHETADWLAIDKPAGLLVHATSLDAHEALNARDLLQAQRGEPLWTVHRLDKGTSGLLLFARSAAAARELADAFEQGAIDKRYLALVRGWPPAEGLIDHPLARDPEKPSAGQPHGPAKTRYRVLQTLEWPLPMGGHDTCRLAIVEAQPQQGRRHQIRRHFKHIGHPLIGDSTHGKGPLNRAVAAHIGTARLWLHASELRLPGQRALHCPPGPAWAALGLTVSG